MAEPTLKDVLDAIAQLRAETAKGFAKVDKRFDDLDTELTTHAKVHKELEKDVRRAEGPPATDGGATGTPSAATLTTNSSPCRPARPNRAGFSGGAVLAGSAAEHPAGPERRTARRLGRRN
ncbi:MAG TPA: hypothetical protein VM925_29910 [Labilithrix sp.]|nr:hypothetical protein [Labilithrix sp.]